jgi:hypothetical protein
MRNLKSTPNYLTIGDFLQKSRSAIFNGWQYLFFKIAISTVIQAITIHIVVIARSCPHKILAFSTDSIYLSDQYRR